MASQNIINNCISNFKMPYPILNRGQWKNKKNQNRVSISYGTLLDLSHRS